MDDICTATKTRKKREKHHFFLHTSICSNLINILKHTVTHRWHFCVNCKISERRTRKLSTQTMVKMCSDKFQPLTENKNQNGSIVSES